MLPFDADDVLLPGALSRLAGRLRAEPGLAACCGAITDGRTRERHHWPRRWPFALARVPLAFAVLNAMSSLYPVPGTVFRTELLREATTNDPGNADDWVLAVALAFRGRVGFEPAPVRRYARREGSILASWTSTDALDHSRTVRRRLRTDRAVPRAVRLLVPVIGLAHALVLRGLRPVAAAASPLRRREGL